MKKQFLGIAAYEGIPAMFCNCENCRTSMEKGGKNMRSCSQAIINDDLLLDFPSESETGNRDLVASIGVSASEYWWSLSDMEYERYGTIC